MVLHQRYCGTGHRAPPSDLHLISRKTIIPQRVPYARLWMTKSLTIRQRQTRILLYDSLVSILLLRSKCICVATARRHDPVSNNRCFILSINAAAGAVRASTHLRNPPPPPHISDRAGTGNVLFVRQCSRYHRIVFYRNICRLCIVSRLLKTDTVKWAGNNQWRIYPQAYGFCRLQMSSQTPFVQSKSNRRQYDTSELNRQKKISTIGLLVMSR